mgnify:CR=1 FL=1
MISEITNNIAIGEYGDIIDSIPVIRNRINCIVNLREKDEIEKRTHTRSGIKNFSYFWSPVITPPEEDKKKFIRECIKIIKIVQQQLSLGKKVLVHCTAGGDQDC